MRVGRRAATVVLLTIWAGAAAGCGPDEADAPAAADVTTSTSGPDDASAVPDATTDGAGSTAVGSTGAAPTAAATETSANQRAATTEPELAATTVAATEATSSSRASGSSPPSAASSSATTAVTGGPAGGPAVLVQSIDNTFRPQRIEVPVGTTVTWENRGRNAHDIVADGWGVAKEEFAPGDSFSHTFDTPGEYPYHCTLHGTADAGMTGLVIVTG